MNSDRQNREAGYTMVMFVVIIAVMAIFMGVAVQTAEFQMRREREAELIFRGQQYIEAIRLYKTKYGRYPMQMKEIWEAKPKVIRQKFKDPITDSENWGIIFLGQEGRAGQQGRQLVGPGGPQSNFDSGGRPIGTHTPFGGNRRNQSGGRQNPGSPGQAGEGEIDPRTGLPRNPWMAGGGADRKMGPIVGVHSTSCDEAIKIYEGHTTYCEWKFVYREEKQRRGPAAPSAGHQPPVGWHPGDKLERDEEGNLIKIPGGGNDPETGTGPGGGVPPVVPTHPRP